MHYDRVRKVERNMFDKKNSPLRRSVGEWMCRRAEAEGQPLVRVHFRKEQDITPKPHLRKGRVESGTVGRRTTELQTVECP